MAFTRLSGGDAPKGIDRRYKLIYSWTFDNTSKTITVPTGTDFLILWNAYYNPTTTGGTGTIPKTSNNPVADTILVVVTEIGETKRAYKMIYGERDTASTWSQIEWTSATSAKITRQNTGGAVTIFAAQYLD